MLDHYSHVRLEAKRAALNALAGGNKEVQFAAKQGGCDTNHATNQQGESEHVPQVVENMVELVGIEPTTSSLRRLDSSVPPVSIFSHLASFLPQNWCSFLER
jgi:hypothetical protein